jgi:hypothetical protein
VRSWSADDRPNFLAQRASAPAWNDDDDREGALANLDAQIQRISLVYNTCGLSPKENGALVSEAVDISLLGAARRVFFGGVSLAAIDRYDWRGFAAIPPHRSTRRAVRSCGPSRANEKRRDNMASSGRPSMNKRRKELERRQWQEQKAGRRAQRVEEARSRPTTPGEDPDIAGLVPGPQPPPED